MSTYRVDEPYDNDMALKLLSAEEKARHLAEQQRIMEAAVALERQRLAEAAAVERQRLAEAAAELERRRIADQEALQQQRIADRTAH